MSRVSESLLLGRGPPTVIELPCSLHTGAAESDRGIACYALFIRPWEASRECRQIARTRRLANDDADLRYAAISLCSCAPPCEDVCAWAFACGARFGACLSVSPHHPRLNHARTRLRGHPLFPWVHDDVRVPDHATRAIATTTVQFTELTIMKHGTPQLLNPANRRKVILSHAHLGKSAPWSARA